MSRRRAFWLLMLIVVGHLSGSVFWVIYDERPPIGQDCIRHGLNALRFAPGAARFTVDLIDMNDRYLDSYPPAHATVLSLAYRAFGVSKKTANGLSTVFFAILLLVVFAIGRALLPDDPRPALLATFILGCFPALFASSRFSNLSMMLTLFVATSVLALIRSDHFNNTTWAIAIGLLMGIGSLVKWTFVVFVVGPLALTLLGGLSRDNALRRVRNAAMTLVIAALVTLLWYVRHATDVIALWRYNRELYGVFYRKGFISAWNLGFYAVRLTEGMTPFLAAFCVVAVVVLVVNRRLKRLAVPLSWIASGYLGLVFIQPKWPRYVIPFYPALALLLAAGLFAIPRSKKRVVLVAAAILVGTVMWAQGILPHDVIATTFKASFFESHIVPVYPVPQDWGIIRIIRTVEDDWSTNAGMPTVVVLPKPPELLAAWCHFESALRGKRILFLSLACDDFFWKLMDGDYIVTRTGPFLPMSWETAHDPQAGALVDGQTELLQDFLESPHVPFGQHYRLIARFRDTDGQTITIARRNLKFSLKEKLELLELLSPIFRENEHKDIAFRILYRQKGWYRHSRKVWEQLEDKGLNRSWLETERGPDLVDVLEVEDMLHNFGANIFAGRRVQGGWEILRPSTQLAPVLLPDGKALISLVAKASPRNGAFPTIQVSLDRKRLWRGEVTSEEPRVYRFEAQTGKRRGMLSIKMLAPDGSAGSSQGSVLIDKVIIRKTGYSKP